MPLIVQSVVVRARHRVGRCRRTGRLHDELGTMMIVAHLHQALNIAMIAGLHDGSTLTGAPRSRVQLKHAGARAARCASYAPASAFKDVFQKKFRCRAGRMIVRSV